MIRRWQVRLELTRDDDGPLTEADVESLRLLLDVQRASPTVALGDPGMVSVELTVDARDDMGARSAAERLLRDGANTVWAEMGLPPFTIKSVAAASLQG
jgi:hypothetical protein